MLPYFNKNRGASSARGNTNLSKPATRSTLVKCSRTCLKKAYRVAGAHPNVSGSLCLVDSKDLEAVSIH